MAAAPQFKVFNAQGEYVAACKEIELAAVLVSFLGDGSQIRKGHNKNAVLWTEGKEDQPASQSYDRVVELARWRMRSKLSVRSLRIRTKLGKEG